LTLAKAVIILVSVISITFTASGLIWNLKNVIDRVEYVNDRATRLNNHLDERIIKLEQKHEQKEP
jgi:low affinity Fe/Cu permease